MNRSTIDLWVGIFVVIGIGAIAFLSLKVGNLTSVSSAPGYHLEASFDNIGGLKLRAPIKAAGVVVGRVAYDPSASRHRPTSVRLSVYTSAMIACVQKVYDTASSSPATMPASRAAA